MKASLRALAAKLSPFKTAPAVAATPAPAAPVIEAEDTEAYSGPMAEEIINKLVDQLDSTRAQVRALAQTNRTLTAQMTQANATISALRKQPKNRYWNQRKG
jgi:hypothetical protein